MLAAEYAFLKYAAAGLELGVLFAKTDAMDDADQDRGTIVDVNLVLEGHYPYLAGKGEVYVKMPLGLAIAVPSNDLDDEYETGTGWTVGLLFGNRYFFWGGLGCEFELGWQGHGVGGDRKTVGEFESTSHQFQLRLGLIYGF